MLIPTHATLFMLAKCEMVHGQICLFVVWSQVRTGHGLAGAAAAVPQVALIVKSLSPEILPKPEQFAVPLCAGMRWAWDGRRRGHDPRKRIPHPCPCPCSSRRSRLRCPRTCAPCCWMPGSCASCSAGCRA